MRQKLPDNFAIFARMHRRNRSHNFLEMQTKLRPPIRGQNQNGELPAAKVLLVTDVLVGSYHQLKLCFRHLEQKTIRDGLPAHFPSCLDGMAGEELTKSARSVLVQQNLHAVAEITATSGRSECAATNSSTSRTCASFASNHSRKSATLAPVARLSKSALMGSRVPLNTHALLTFPGTLSTAGHCD